MQRNTASSVDQAIEWLRRWKSESRTILVTYISTRLENAVFRFIGKVADFEGPAIRVIGSEGYAAFSLTGATVDPDLPGVAADALALFAELRESAPDVPIVELLLPSRAVVFFWREDHWIAPRTAHSKKRD